MKLLPRGLRARSATGFALLALLLSVVLSVATYQLARRYLLDQRQSLAVKQAILHAQVLGGQLSGLTDPSDQELLGLLLQTKSRAVLEVGSSWYSAVVDLDQSRIPAALIDAARAGTRGIQRVRVNETPYFVIGLPVEPSGSAYFEFVPAVELERTLETLGYVLVVVASVTTLVGALSGWILSRRVMRPLETVAASARLMSEGQLDQRLEVGDDPDLRPVAESFNAMATALSDRIERERRFTGDVSHELRTPLTAMISAVALAQRASDPVRMEYAIDVLAEQTEHLRCLTVELLELAGIDAGRNAATKEVVDVAPIVARQAELHSVRSVVEGRLDLPLVHELSPLRFERILANLLENAQRYGGGAVAVHCHKVGTTLRLVVDDAGPGVPFEERTAIFGRFHRGSAAVSVGAAKGTGLGLSLVDEFARLDGGRVWVEDSPMGGARFVVEIPAPV